MLQVTKEFNFEDFESLLKKIEEGDGDVLLLPSKTPKFRGALGAEGALVQLVITWARSRSARAMKVHVKDNSMEPLESLCAEAHGIVGLSLAPKILDLEDQPIPRNRALAPAVPRILAMDSMGSSAGSTAKGAGINLICVTGAEREYLFPLYSSRTSKSLRSRAQFRGLLEYIFSSIVPHSEQAKFSPSAASELGDICRELISNTDDHATTDVRRNQYLRNVRGLITSYSNVDTEFVANISAHRPELAEYFRARAHRFENRESVKLFELSVFDAGPGLARRQLGKDFAEMSLAEELNATKACFGLGRTTKDSASSGLGLYSVWRLLRSVKGFIRIRTGRHALFRTFNGNESDNDFELWHWDPQGRELPAAEGLLVTIIVPTRA